MNGGEKMQEVLTKFLSSAYGVIASFAAGVAMFWGLFKAAGAFRKWVDQIVSKHREKQNIPVKMMEAIEAINAKVNENNDAIEAIAEQINMLTDRMNDNDESTATLMLEKMMWAYHYYVLQGKEIALDTQTALCVMFDQYKKNGSHNHVPNDFKQRIMACKVVGSK